MKWLKRIFIAIGILGVICLVGYIVYNVAYTMGETTGYERGYSEGEGIGYSSGKKEGYEIGKTDGYSLGEQEGYKLGSADGYAKGMEAGLGHGYTLKDPTYDQAVTFIREDRTNENKYVEDTYVCSHFARDACNNAEQKGFRCAFAVMTYSDKSHTIIAFNTIDEGLVYFEPQTDERVKPVVGKRYYQCIEPRPGYYYPPLSYDDTIRDILVIW